MRLPSDLAWLALALSGCFFNPDSGGVVSDDDPPPTSEPTTCVPVPEQCDAVDNDCDGEVDEGFPTTWFPDADGDGVGLADDPFEGCDPPAGHVPDAGDCDDSDPALVGPVGELRYRDATVEAGLDWLHWDPAEEPCGTEALAGGAAAADYDNDGDVDLFFPRLYSQDLLFENLGDGTFTERATELQLVDPQGASAGALWLDVDGDRDLDLYVTSVGRSGAKLWINSGPGNSFSEQAAERGVDVDFGSDCAQAFSASAADVDLDGDLDLHTTAWFDPLQGGNPRARLFLNDGTGHFTDGTTAWNADLSDRASFTTRFADVDGDRVPDLLVAADWGDSLWLRNANGAFFAVAQDDDAFTDENGMGAATGDIDGDGDLDWFVTSIFDPTTPCPPGWGCSGNRLYRNDDGRFVDATDAAGVREGGWGWGAALFDFDNDGDLDLGHAAGFDAPGFADDTARLWRNDGTGAFTEITCEAALVDRGQGRAFVPFDSDNDGDLDVFVVHNGDLPALWRAEGAEDRGWLRVLLDQPRENNRFGIGAQVRVIAAPGDDPITRPIEASSGFGGTGPPEAHFGLGDHAGPVEQVLVTWPDGGTSSYTGVGPGLVTLTRP
jgi:hypothetical protein